MRWALAVLDVDRVAKASAVVGRMKTEVSKIWWEKGEWFSLSLCGEAG